MMLSIKKLTAEDSDKIKEIITEPSLWKLTYGQGIHQSCFKVDLTFDYLLVEETQKGIIGLFQTRALTKMLVECHSYMLPKFWGTEYSKEAVKLGFNYLIENTTFLKCFTDIPDDCKEVLKASERMGWKKIGTVDNGVIYNNKLQKLHFYEYSLRGV